MPELAEVRAHAERLQAAFQGAELETFVATSFTALKTVSPSPEAAIGRALSTVASRGKLLVVRFGSPEGSDPGQFLHADGSRSAASDQIGFVIHLMQAGRLRPEMGKRVSKRSDRARWHFADGRSLVLTEAGTERAAGIWVTIDPEADEPIAHLGPDADTVDSATLRDLLQSTSMRLHGFLRDQRRLAGLGRRLANEICHRAQLSPFAVTTKLSGEEIVRLGNAITAQIAADLAVERTRTEMSSSKQRLSNVHNRIGESCPACGDTIRAVEYRAYTIAYCPTCQTAGRVLADNTTSKFLK